MNVRNGHRPGNGHDGQRRHGHGNRKNGHGYRRYGHGHGTAASRGRNDGHRRYEHERRSDGDEHGNGHGGQRHDGYGRLRDGVWHDGRRNGHLPTWMHDGLLQAGSSLSAWLHTILLRESTGHRSERALQRRQRFRSITTNPAKPETPKLSAASPAGTTVSSNSQ